MLLLGCTPQAAPPTLECADGTVLVHSVSPLRSVEVHHGALRLARRRAPEGTLTLSLPAPAPPGSELIVEVARRDGRHTLTCRAPASAGPVQVQVAAPSGQAPRPLVGDLELPIAGALQYSVVLTARQAGAVDVRLGEESVHVELPVPGQREVLTRPLPPNGPTTIEVRAGEHTARGRLIPLPFRGEQVTGLTVVEQSFPATPTGRPEPARSPDRVELPARWWTAFLAISNLGFRPRDPAVPWGHRGVELRNDGAFALDVALQSVVLGPEGPAAAFRPRMRGTDGDTGVVTALLRVPAGGSARAVLPVFVDEAALTEGASLWTHELRVTALGASQPLLVERTPIAVRRGSSLVSLVFAGSLLAGLLGTGLALRKTSGWLRAFRTADLTMIAVFSTLSFVVSGATALFGSFVAAVLGPFSGFVTALLDDCLRHSLLATLIVLLPRRGVATLYVLVGWILRSLALGGVEATDLISVGGRIFWLEVLFALVGLTHRRAATSLDGAALWARLVAALGGASVLGTAGGLATAMVLYRLHYAGWYVAATLALPGFLYDVLACALAVGFARALRQVET